MELKERLKIIRLIRGLSLPKLAKKAGLDKGYLGKLERGEIKTPGYKVPEKLAAALQVPEVWLKGPADIPGYNERAEYIRRAQQEAAEFEAHGDMVRAIRAHALADMWQASEEHWLHFLAAVWERSGIGVSGVARSGGGEPPQGDGGLTVLRVIHVTEL